MIILTYSVRAKSKQVYERLVEDNNTRVKLQLNSGCVSDFRGIIQMNGWKADGMPNMGILLIDKEMHWLNKKWHKTIIKVAFWYSDYIFGGTTSLNEKSYKKRTILEKFLKKNFSDFTREAEII